MYTITVESGLRDARLIYNIMKQMFPYGTNSLETDAAAVLDMDWQAKPDVIWLASGNENYEAANMIRRQYPQTNFIFVGKDTSGAYEAMQVRASGYILEPVTEEAVEDEIAELRHPADTGGAQLRIQCFGSFEVFSHGRIVKFSRSLSKEALAYLVDRRGASCTISELCTVLWEDRTMSTSLKSQCRVIMAALKKDLESVGAGDILVKMWNAWGIDVNKVSCDYYDYLKNGQDAANPFLGEYMSRYSWAEMTAGTLLDTSDENPGEEVQAAK